MPHLNWSPQGWEDYLHWQQQDKKTLKRINILLRDMTRNPFEGIGEPEPLKHEWSGYWSRRIDKQNRIIYKVKEDMVLIARCRGHYSFN